MSFDCLNIPTVPNPQGIDVIINNIQTQLGLISWMDYSFGKAYLKKEDRSGTTYNIPKAWGGHNEFITLIPTDEVRAFSFVESFETETFNDYENRKFDYSSTTDISLVVFANLDMIDNSKNYIFTEELKKDVLNALTSVPSIAVTSIEKGLDSSYSNWSYESIEPSFYSEKYAAFKVNINAVISSSCYQENTYNLTNC